MAAQKVIECPEGVVLRGDDDVGTIATAQKHAKENHEMELTHDQALAMARPG